MSIVRGVLLRMFGRPRGVLGRLGGMIMARMNADCGSWVAGLLEVGPNDSVLEVGFGPGVVIQCVSTLAPAGNVAGVDQSAEMVELARARNAAAVQSGRVDLQHGSVECLPFEDNSLTRPWRSTRCSSGRMRWPDCVRSSGL